MRGRSREYRNLVAYSEALIMPRKSSIVPGSLIAAIAALSRNRRSNRMAVHHDQNVGLLAPARVLRARGVLSRRGGRVIAARSPGRRRNGDDFAQRLTNARATEMLNLIRQSSVSSQYPG